MCLQSDGISPDTESLQVLLNGFKVNSSWGNWAPPDKTLRNPWLLLLYMVTLFILHLMSWPIGSVTGNVGFFHNILHSTVIPVCSPERGKCIISIKTLIKYTAGACTAADLVLALTWTLASLVWRLEGVMQGLVGGGKKRSLQRGEARSAQCTDCYLLLAEHNEQTTSPGGHQQTRQQSH